MNKQFCPEIKIAPENVCEGFRNDLFPHNLILYAEKPFEIPRYGKRYVITKVKLQGEIFCHRWKGNKIIAEAKVEIENFKVGEVVDVRATCQGCLYVDKKRNWVASSKVVLDGIDHGLPIQKKLLLE